MKTLVEVSYEKEGILKEDESPIEKDQFWLLHWGVKFEVINDIAVNYTVAICQNVNTGEIICFYPEQLKIIGQKIEK
jgi:hypothetical protein